MRGCLNNMNFTPTASIPECSHFFPFLLNEQQTKEALLWDTSAPRVEQPFITQWHKFWQKLMQAISLLSSNSAKSLSTFEQLWQNWRWLKQFGWHISSVFCFIYEFISDRSRVLLCVLFTLTHRVYFHMIHTIEINRYLLPLDKAFDFAQVTTLNEIVIFTQFSLLKAVKSL